jgi:hypothetical protein
MIHQAPYVNRLGFEQWERCSFSIVSLSRVRVLESQSECGRRTGEPVQSRATRALWRLQGDDEESLAAFDSVLERLDSSHVALESERS